MARLDFDRLMGECRTVQEQYELQLMIRDVLLERQAANEEQMALLHSFVQANKAWEKCTDEATYREQWKEIAEAADRSRRRQAKFQKAKQNVLERWSGPIGAEWLSGHDSEYAITHFTKASRKYGVEDIKPRLIPVIMDRIRRDTGRGRDVSCRAIPRDFERVSGGDGVPPVTRQDLERFRLFVDKDGLLRPYTDVSRGRVQALPPSPPPANLEEPPKSPEHADFAEIDMANPNHLENIVRFADETLNNLYALPSEPNPNNVPSPSSQQPATSKRKFAEMEEVIDEAFRPSPYSRLSSVSRRFELALPWPSDVEEPGPKGALSDIDLRLLGGSRTSSPLTPARGTTHDFPVGLSEEPDFATSEEEERSEKGAGHGETGTDPNQNTNDGLDGQVRPAASAPDPPFSPKIIPFTPITSGHPAAAEKTTTSPQPRPRSSSRTRRTPTSDTDHPLPADDNINGDNEDATKKPPPKKQKKTGCQCAEEVDEEWKEEVHEKGAKRFSEAWALLYRAPDFHLICFLHRRKLASRLGLRATQTSDDLDQVLNQIYDKGDGDALWDLEMDPATYHLFKPSHRPPRHSDAVGPFQFPAPEWPLYKPAVDNL